MTDTITPHVASPSRSDRTTCAVCSTPTTTSEVHHPPGATLHLGGTAWAHPDLSSTLYPATRDVVLPGSTVLQPYPGNANIGDLDAITDSIQTNGIYRPLYVQTSTGHVLAGNHTLQAARDRLGAEQMPVVWLDVDDDHARRIVLVDNRSADLSGTDETLLLEMLRAAAEVDEVLAGTAFDADVLAAMEAAAQADRYDAPAEKPPSLADRFVVPPFTVLDARGGGWQERKRRWLTLGIQSEVGRGGDGETLGATQTNLDGKDAARYGRAERTLAQGLQARRDPATGDLVYEPTTAAGISIFDPVLCELAYRWFCPPGGTVLDPFAGGSVRGVVAGALGRSYVGCELRPEQVEANRAQWDAISPRLPSGPDVAWHTGDSRDLLVDLPGTATTDLVFSCPPYADLEVYSDDPRDLSAMPYGDFLAAYRDVILMAVEALRPDRFAVWVVGEVRDRRGDYRGLVPDTIRAFTDAGATFYNEAVLVTPVGSLPIRAGRQFAAGRKLGKTHQNVLVFAKGDARAAAAACGHVDVTMPETTDPEVVHTP